ncbi:MAG: hypothetical protein KKF08_18955 [Gammaproteobacteria bacterium]|nr:hypothetical protein [Gammaproteobacteria bacterium]
MTSAVPLIHSALEFRLQVLLRAMCNSNTSLGESSNIAAHSPLVLCNKHGLRKRHSIVAYRFFNNLADQSYSFKNMKFFKHSGNRSRDIGTSLDLSIFLNHPKVNQELLQLLFYSLKTAVDFYNHLNDIKGMNLRDKDSYYSESDYHYYDIREQFITLYQRKAYKEVMSFKNRSSRMVEAMNYFVQKSTELIRLLDVKLNSYYVLYDLSKKK